VRLFRFFTLSVGTLFKTSLQSGAFLISSLTFFRFVLPAALIKSIQAEHMSYSNISAGPRWLSNNGPDQLLPPLARRRYARNHPPYFRLTINQAPAPHQLFFPVLVLRKAYLSNPHSPTLPSLSSALVVDKSRGPPPRCFWVTSMFVLSCAS